MHHGGDSSSEAAAVARHTRTPSDFSTSPLEQESSASYHNSPLIHHGRHIGSRSSPLSTAQSPTRNDSATMATSRHKDRKAPPIFHFLAGLVTGSLSAVLLQPADLLKTRVQQSQARTSVSTALREILSQPGVVRQLWRGTLPSVIRTGFGSALYFASLSTLRSTFANNAALNGDGMAANKLETPERRATSESNGGKVRIVEQEPGQMAELAWSQSTKGAILRDREAIKKAELLSSPALDSTVTVHTPPALPASHNQSLSSGASTSSASIATTPSSSALPKLSNAANLLTGALARSGAGLVMMPITVLKVRYESSLYSSYHARSASSGGTGLIGAARTIFAREGLRGLYAGYGATLVRDAPYAGLYVLFYERAKGFLGRVATPIPSRPPSNLSNVASDGKNAPPVLGFIGTTTQANTINFGAGIIAAAAATAVTNPFDAIKTRIQLMPARYRNTASAAATMMREEGPRAFFDGLGLRMARKAMSSALAWTIYEDLVRRAEKRYAEMGRSESEDGAVRM